MRRALLRFFFAMGLAVTLLHVEGHRVLLAAGAEVAGEWEAFLLSREVPAIAALALAPLILAVVAYASMLPLLGGRRGRLAWGVAMSMIATALAVELSTGRKARALGVRVPFVILLAGVAFVLAAFVLPRVRELARGRAWPALFGGAALVACAVFADARVLPGLYPVFHHALSAVVAIGLVLFVDAYLDALETTQKGRIAAVALATVAALFFVSAARRAPSGARGLARYENARRIADERSAVLARAVRIAAEIHPPAVDEPPEVNDPLSHPATRAVDARGRDLLLITIDALRADHVGAYAYARKTPAIDRLADEGVVFEHAYTPTPHTSYAITSLMTGKYMRPILALEAASGEARRADDTWAGLFRIYGFRTAAFFPPAVWAVDGDRFTDLRAHQLDFEHAKIEFAAPDLIDAQLGSYLERAPPGKPLFVWVHMFEPHEPYVTHPLHAFGDGEIERYDSEIATDDDGVDKMVRRFRAARPGAIVILSADHGEAFGEHGARYHGTTVYEEQVRVPLIVSAPGLLRHRVERSPVQLVDLLPTALSMFDIPRPPRVRGRDLGPMLSGAFAGPGVAYAEVEDAAMIARGNDRLLCKKKIATCGLYDVERDPLELSAISDPSKSELLRSEMKALVTASAALEGFARGWPESLRRAYAGDPTAAAEVAPLLDDVDVAFRRRAAEMLARLARAETEAAVHRSLARETDGETKRWLVVAHARIAHGLPPFTAPTLSRLVASSGAGSAIARFAALAQGELRACGVAIEEPRAAYDVLVAWLPDAAGLAGQLPAAGLDGDLGRAILAVLPLLHEKGTPATKAVERILPLLDDVRLRVAAADALAALGDKSAQKPLAARLEVERHQDVRVSEARALARSGDPALATAFLTRFLGVPVPAPGAADALAAVAKSNPPPWLDIVHGGRARPTVPKSARQRLYVIGLIGGSGTKLDGRLPSVRIAGVEVALVRSDAGLMAEVQLAPGPIAIEAPGAQWIAIVPRVDDLPPPKAPRSLGDAASEPGSGDGGPEHGP